MDKGVGTIRCGYVLLGEYTIWNGSGRYVVWGIMGCVIIIQVGGHV